MCLLTFSVLSFVQLPSIKNIYYSTRTDVFYESRKVYYMQKFVAGDIYLCVCVYICALFIKCTVKNIFAHHCSPAASEIVVNIILAALKY